MDHCLAGWICVFLGASNPWGTALTMVFFFAIGGIMDKVFYRLAELRWMLNEAAELIEKIAGELALEAVKGEEE